MQLENNFDPKKIEHTIRDKLSNLDLESLLSESDRDEIIFIEGPPTMNGTPHAGHLRGRVIKDLWYRYNILQGKKITFNAGWDAQGLPVELQAQKELGIEGGKTKLEGSIGVERLVLECKKIVKKYHKQWVIADKLLGMSFNQDKAYWTYTDEFIEREWQFLKKANQNGILEDDYTVIAYCPSCQTSLSHAEVSQGYAQVTDPSLYYKARLVDEDAYLVVWTTMPFTLVTDAMIGLHPDEDYHYIAVNNETWIIGHTRLEQFLKEAKITDYSIQKTIRGSKLEGKRYVHPLYDKIPKLAQLSQDSGYHVVVSEEFVDASTGSGLVHLSPANGEEDIKIANRRNMVVFSPINDEAKFTFDAGEYAGSFVRDTDSRIVDDLRERDALVKIGKIKHNYPLCWRSGHPVVWLARRGWFYKLDRLDNKAVKAAESVEYFFEQPRNRFLGIVRERHPWCISRERFWGCPLPAWNCHDCKNRDWFYSRQEIVNAAKDLPDGDDFELHRPWIDNITIKCTKCGSSNTQREQYVLDTWHNSGAAPFASLDDDSYTKYIPAPFLTEGIDQTRGWAYTLLIENVLFNNSPAPPYESFLFQGHVLDENGNKMSKSLGNVIDAQSLLTKYPADLVRFYFMWKSSPIESLSFSTDEMMSRPYNILGTLYHLHLYFVQNSKYDGFDHTSDKARDDHLEPPDIWILSKLQKLVKNTSELNNRCRFHESAREIEDFIINVLSKTYIPITRAQLWDEDESKKPRRLAIYSVLYDILKTLDILMHPLCPFTTEYLYAGTFGTKNSILLETWPHAKTSLEDDSLEESFDLLREIVSASSAARMKANLKRRWPLNEAIICVKRGKKETLESLVGLLRSQLNVERLVIHEAYSFGGLEQIYELKKLGLAVKSNVHLDRKRIGPKAKHLMGALAGVFERTDPDSIADELQKSGTFEFDLDGNSLVLDIDDFEIGLQAKEGFALSGRENLVVLLSTTRNHDMMAHGLVKDVARRLQALRKERGYDPTDMLDVASVLDLESEQEQMLQDRAQDLAFLVRVKRIDLVQSCKEYKDTDIDGQKIRISVE